MPAPRFRPTFTRTLRRPPDDAAAALAPLVEPTPSNDPPPYEGQRVGRHVTLAPHRERHRLYSAHLTIELEPDETDPERSLLRARFHPRPALWTLVMAIELGCLTGACIAAMWGASQLMLDHNPTALYVMTVLLAAAGALLIAAYIAQRVDRPNMIAMRDSVDDTLGTHDQQTPPN